MLDQWCLIWLLSELKFVPRLLQMSTRSRFQDRIKFAIRINVTCFHGNNTKINVNILWISIWFTLRIHVNNSYKYCNSQLSHHSVKEILWIRMMCNFLLPIDRIIYLHLIIAGSLESANSSILPVHNLFKDFGGEKNQDFMLIRLTIPVIWLAVVGMCMAN